MRLTTAMTNEGLANAVDCIDDTDISKEQLEGFVAATSVLREYRIFIPQFICMYIFAILQSS